MMLSLLHTLTSPSQVLIFAHTVHIHTQGKALPNSHHLLCTHFNRGFFQFLTGGGELGLYLCGYGSPAGQGFPGVASEQRHGHTL